MIRLKITKIIATLIFVTTSISANATMIIQDFESDLPGVIFAGSSSSVTINTTNIAPADTIPSADVGNTVLQFNASAAADPGFGFVAQDFITTSNWSDYSGLSFWLYGSGLGNSLFFDIREDDGGEINCCSAEIWSYTFADATAGWSLINIPFSAFVYKTGASDDGLGLTDVRGWGFGYEEGIAETTYYIDDIRLVPEPNSLVIFGLGLAGLSFLRRKKIQRII